MRIYLTLDADERRVLGELSRRDLRNPKDQLRYLLRREAARLHLLPNTEDERGTYATEAEDRAAEPLPPEEHRRRLDAIITELTALRDTLP